MTTHNANVRRIAWTNTFTLNGNAMSEHEVEQSQENGFYEMEWLHFFARRKQMSEKSCIFATRNFITNVFLCWKSIESKPKNKQFSAVERRQCRRRWKRRKFLCIFALFVVFEFSLNKVTFLASFLSPFDCCFLSTIESSQLLLTLHNSNTDSGRRNSKRKKKAKKIDEMAICVKWRK